MLEIAPGHGRWTEYLAHHCDRLIGVDLASSCVEVCRERFDGRPNLEFFVNDGRSLDMVDAGSVDLVFSFDSLVHAEWACSAPTWNRSHSSLRQADLRSCTTPTQGSTRESSTVGIASAPRRSPTWRPQASVRHGIDEP